MKSFLCCLAITLFSFSALYSQTFNYTTPEHITLREQGGSAVTLKLLAVTISNSGATSYFTSGYGASASALFKMGSVVSFFTELTLYRIKYVDEIPLSSGKNTVSEGMKPSILISIGTKIYPSRDNFKGYGKIGLGLMSRMSAKNNNTSISIPPVLTLGLGYEIKLSNYINIFPEGEINFMGQSTEFMFGVGGMYVL
ncbi:MAG: hypothetical protein PHN88_10120 [Ignavibacteria bacterium]|nr:hypothetical protein [Ignavibacteria bacterium]